MDNGLKVYLMSISWQQEEKAKKNVGLAWQRNWQVSHAPTNWCGYLATIVHRIPQWKGDYQEGESSKMPKDKVGKMSGRATRTLGANNAPQAREREVTSGVGKGRHWQMVYFSLYEWEKLQLQQVEVQCMNENGNIVICRELPRFTAPNCKNANGLRVYLR